MLKLWTEVAAEPSLDEVLDDPIVHLLMRGDGTGVNQVRELITQIQERLGVNSEDSEVAEPPAQDVDATRAA